MIRPPGVLAEGEVSVRISESKSTEGFLAVPEESSGIVVFAHGSGSGRHSPRNRLVADRLNGSGLATLLFDLLTDSEEETDRVTGEYRFDIGLLSARVGRACRWTRDNRVTKKMGIGVFGASTGAAAAIIAAAENPGIAGAVVSRGGRVDLAGEALEKLRCPALFIVGGRDHFVKELNARAMRRINAPAEMVEIPGASHLFEEPGALEEVADRAGEWFMKHL